MVGQDAQAGMRGIADASQHRKGPEAMSEPCQACPLPLPDLVRRRFGIPVRLGYLLHAREESVLPDCLINAKFRQRRPLSPGFRVMMQQGGNA